MISSLPCSHSDDGLLYDMFTFPHEMLHISVVFPHLEPLEKEWVRCNIVLDPLTPGRDRGTGSDGAQDGGVVRNFHFGE